LFSVPAELHEEFRRDKDIEEDRMAFDEPAPRLGLQDTGNVSGPIRSIHYSHERSDILTEIVLDILGRYRVTLDTQSFPATLYAESLIYMIYWFHRLRDPIRKNSIEVDMARYLSIEPRSPVIASLLSDQQLKTLAKDRIEQGTLVRRTVDVLVMREGPSGKEFLILDRAFFPTGMALPGGLLRDEDELNDAGIPGNIFAALRITASKVLQATAIHYGIAERNGRKYYFSATDAGKEARVYMDRTISHAFRDHLKDITAPSDPRHIVDTIGLLVEIPDADGVQGRWIAESLVTTPNTKNGTFAFGHHKQIVSALLAKNFTKTEGVSHHEWIRKTVTNPLDVYRSIRARFSQNNDRTDTPIIELLPVVDYVRSQMFSPTVDETCRGNAALLIMRDQVLHKLHHVTIENGPMCPYAPTLRVLFEAVGFFDVVWRTRKNLSTHFQKNYWYRYESLMSRIPEAIIIPTFDNISATDFLKVLGTAIYFVGLSAEPVYVDEFWQSPLEFLIHDLNHAWKMLDMDDKFLQAHPDMSSDEIMEASNRFIRDYLATIAVQKSDTELQKEIKKLKKILLFEVGHEDGRPLLPSIITETLLEAEGYEFPDNVVRYDDDESQAYLERRIIGGITTLSYVRHKLQHGFFDQTDSQNIQIVSPKFRSVGWIVTAAVELLGEMRATIPPQIQAEGLTEYLTRQACSRGPTILHAPENLDPVIENYGDGTMLDTSTEVAIDEC
jgi:hypothetical protein